MEDFSFVISQDPQFKKISAEYITTMEELRRFMGKDVILLDRFLSVQEKLNGCVKQKCSEVILELIQDL